MHCSSPTSTSPTLLPPACPQARPALPVTPWDTTMATVQQSPENATTHTRPRQLPSTLQLHILSLLPPNEQALSGRFVCPDASSALCSTASLSQPLPPHAAPWAQEASQTVVRQLSLTRRLRLLGTAAASGSEVNLEVAWAVVQPSIFPVLPPRKGSSHAMNVSMSALRAGQPRVLGWLLQRCPELVEPNRVLYFAARDCELAGLQAVWQMLQDGYGRRVIRYPPQLDHGVLDGAAGSATPDAVAKVEWVRDQGGQECRLQPSAVKAAIDAGQMGTLRWLRDQGCPTEPAALACALQHLDLASLQWLVDEGLCSLPPVNADTDVWRYRLETAVKGPDGVAKLQWLQQRGAPALDRGDTVRRLAGASAIAGRVEVMQHLLAAYGPAAVLQRDPYSFGWGIAAVAARSGSIPMAECLRDAGAVFEPASYCEAASRGHLPMVRWLALEAGLSAAGLSGWDFRCIINVWPNNTAADSRDLLEAVQLVVGAGFCRWVEEWVEDEPPSEGEQVGDRDDAFDAAVRRGDLALVQYLLQQMPQPERFLRWSVLAVAADAGCETLLEWLVQQPGCLLADPWELSPYVAAAANGDRGTVEALQRLGVPWGADDVVVQAVNTWCCTVPALRWLVEQGAPMGSRAELEEAIEDREQNCVDLKEEDAAWVRSLEAAETEDVETEEWETEEPETEETDKA